jgi:hypothetical protein
MSTRFDADRTQINSVIDRRSLLRLAVGAPFAVGIAASAQAQQRQLSRKQRKRPRGPVELDGHAGMWNTWVISSARSVLPAAPPKVNSSTTRAELDELLRLQAQRSDATRGLVQFWDGEGGVPVWTQILLDKIKERGTNPVMAARAISLVHTAMSDAAVAAWYAKFTYRRSAPVRLNRAIVPISEVASELPSYVSEHAAVAAAAATVLGYLYPADTVTVHGQRMTFDAAANEAALSRLWAGTNFRSDLNAGLLLGQAVGLMAVQRGASDGSSAVWDTNTQPGRLTGPGRWVPTPPANQPFPLLPLAGNWNPWLLASGSEFRPLPPPVDQGPFPSNAFLQETATVKTTVDDLTPEQLHIAQFWADDPVKTFTPPGHWTQIASQFVAGSNLSAPRAARAMALLGVGLMDAGIACWDCKYAFWVMRPITAIRTMSDQPFYDPSFMTPIGTPPFPAYTSGHSTFSGCSAAVLEHLFPGGTVSDAFGHSATFAEAADQAAVSRLYGGIHYPSDNNEGLTCGRHIAEKVIARAQLDRA